MPKKIPSTKPYFERKKEIFRAFNQIMKSGRLILGPYTREFEEKFAKYTGVKYAIAVSSCTAALEISLRYFNVIGREVIVPTNTFVASANAVLFAGGKPVLTDIDAKSLCMDVEDLKSKINRKTKGVIVVHLAGLVHPKIGQIRKICRENNLFLIEDVAHACGGSFGKKKAGSFGDSGCFSFYPTKITTTGTGGMITTNNQKLYKFAQSLRHHGVGEGLTDIRRLGNDWLMDEFRAVLGIYQLLSIEQAITKRRKIAQSYDRALKNVLGIKLFSCSPGIRHVYYKYPIQLGSIDIRNALKERLKEKYAIQTGSIYYPPVHLHPYAAQYGLDKGNFRIAEAVLQQILCLPVFPDMKKRDVDFVLKCLLKELKSIEKDKK